jgi:hypothetical protein
VSRKVHGVFLFPLSPSSDSQGIIPPTMHHAIGEADRSLGVSSRRVSSCAGLFLAILIGLLLTVSSPIAEACPICSGTAPRLTLLQRLINADVAVIVRPLGAGQFEVLESVKSAPGFLARRGTRLRQLRFAPGEDIPQRADSASVLLLRQSLGGTWLVAGPMPATAAPLVRSMVRAKRTTDMTLADWQARVTTLAPVLEHPVPLLAETAYGEIARAPYAAMRSVRISPTVLESWVSNPALAPRRSLYWLLLGINAGPAEAQRISRRLDALARERGIAELSSLIAADLEAGGRGRRAVLRKLYFEDRSRTLPELQEAALAFTVHADAGDDALRRETAAMYARLVRNHRALGGLVVADLTRWQYWDAVPDYVVLLRSRVLHPVWRQPVIDYLLASGRPEALAALDAIRDFPTLTTSLPIEAR